MPKGETSRPKNRTMRKIDKLGHPRDSQNLREMAQSARERNAAAEKLQAARMKGTMQAELAHKESTRQGRQEYSRKRARDKSKIK